MIALALSMLWNFTFNRRFTFRLAGNVPLAMLKVAMLVSGLLREIASLGTVSALQASHGSCLVESVVQDLITHF